MYAFLEDIYEVEKYAMKMYEAPSISFKKNDFLKRSMEIYAYETTINRCLSNLIFDPLDVMEDYIIELEMYRLMLHKKRPDRDILYEAMIGVVHALYNKMFERRTL